MVCAYMCVYICIYVYMERILGKCPKLLLNCMAKKSQSTKLLQQRLITASVPN